LITITKMIWLPSGG